MEELSFSIDVKYQINLVNHSSETKMTTLTNQQARRFILLKQGLIGEYRFIGKLGILEFIKQAGCIQFDPIDVCGKNSELVLQSRISGVSKQMLFELLYEERQLIDHFDKNLAIIHVDDWKYFDRVREGHRNYYKDQTEINEITEEIRAVISEKGVVSSKDLKFDQRLIWDWGQNTKLSRAALETMYAGGDLVIHHKKGSMKYYALLEDTFDEKFCQSVEPFENEFDYTKWRCLRRISAGGLMWNKPSDAWLMIRNMKSDQRSLIFKELIDEKKIIEVSVIGIKEPLYCVKEDETLLERAMSNEKLTYRTELIAPLDNLIWDRKLIRAIFDFSYTWEIYMPAEKRKYGYYVLPILSGEQFIGRIELNKDKKNRKLILKNIWFEKGVCLDQQLINDLIGCLNRFGAFNECDIIDFGSFISV